MAHTVGPNRPINPRPLDTWLDTSLAGSRFQGHPGRSFVVLDGGPGVPIQEPNAFLNAADGLVHVLANRAGRLYHYKATHPRAPHVEVGKVIGDGVGGEAAQCIHGSLFLDGPNAHVFYIPGAASTTVKVASATTAALASSPLTAFGGQAVVFSKAGGVVPGLNQFGNFSGLAIDGGYRLYIEGSGTQSDSWQTMAAECATVNGAYKLRTGPLISLQPGNVFGSTPFAPGPVSASNYTVTQFTSMASCGPIFWENGQYVQVFHAGGDWGLPTDLYRATSADGIDWKVDLWGYPAGCRRDHRWELDQRADPYPVCIGGVWWCYYTAATNAGPNGGRWVIKAEALSPTYRIFDGYEWVEMDQEPAPVNWRGFTTRNRTVDSATPVMPFDLDICDPGNTANFARVLPPAAPGVRVLGVNISTGTGTLSYTAGANDAILGASPVVVAAGQASWFEAPVAGKWAVMGR